MRFLPSELKLSVVVDEKGSDLIVTDSSATARVEVALLMRTGLFCAA
jgi:hypothetical protein